MLKRWLEKAKSKQLQQREIASSSSALQENAPVTVTGSEFSSVGQPGTSSSTFTEHSQTEEVNEGIIPQKPNQPKAEEVPVQVTNQKNIRFQQSWFDKFPWLHFEATLGGILYHVCALANQNQLLNMATKTDKAFLSSGFKNWKKAIEKFSSHECSATHKLALNNIKQLAATSVSEMLNTQLSNQQK